MFGFGHPRKASTQHPFCPSCLRDFSAEGREITPLGEKGEKGMVDVACLSLGSQSPTSSEIKPLHPASVTQRAPLPFHYSLLGEPYGCRTGGKRLGNSCCCHIIVPKLLQR